MRQGIRRFLILPMLGLALVAACLGVAVALTDPHPATLPRRAKQWLSVAPSNLASLGSAVSRRFVQEKLPPFSDITFDDSGYSAAIRFSKPITDPNSLAQIRASVVGRGERGVAYLEAKLVALPPGDPATPSTSADIFQLLGSLKMYDAKWAEAAAAVAKAQTVDPSRSQLFRANMEALLGVIALRRGEIENCVACCNESSCIFPLAPSAIHQRKEGSREAIGHFTRYLQTRPGDLGIQWLLNVASMTLGEYPHGVPSALRLPLGRFDNTGEDPRRMINIASKVGLNLRGESMAGTCLVDDFDGDGLLDVFMPTTDPERGALLLKNKGDGTFADRSKEAGLADQVLSLNAYHADYDNDGDLDVVLLRGAWELPRRMSLLRNRGDGRFEDVTIAAGLGDPIASQAAGWADYDNDGDVDLYVAGELSPEKPDTRNLGRLYQNRGDGTFVDVAAGAGVANGGFGKGVAWGDYDNDGLADLYISNMGQPNRLYHNQGDGTFVDVAAQLHVAEPIQSFACWFWDYDNDGRLDLWVNPYGSTLSQVIADQLGRPTSGERIRLYRNVSGSEGFRDVSAEVGVDRVILPMGCNFGDIDNDGFLDVYLGTGRPSYSYLMPNVLFRNDGGRKFEDITAATGTGHLQKGHGVALADWDRDGDQDIFLQAGGAAPGDRAHNVLFRNSGSGNHWLTIRLVGNRSNRSAIGARLRVNLEGPEGELVSLHRMISTGSSFGGNPLACTVGLGKAKSVRSLEIIWPASNSQQIFNNICADRSIEITEGRDRILVVEAPQILSQ